MSKFWLTLIVLLLGIGTANSEDLVSMKEMQKHFFHWSKGIHSTELPKGVDVK